MKVEELKAKLAELEPVEEIGEEESGNVQVV